MEYINKKILIDVIINTPSCVAYKNGFDNNVLTALADRQNEIIDLIDRCIQVADVAPVVHGHWETDKHAALDFCSSCGEAVERYVTAEQMDKSNYKGATYWNYCPHCGAIMDEEGNK